MKPSGRLTPDGAWLYFRRLETRGFGVWRVHPDGSGLERVAAGSGPAVANEFSMLCLEIRWNDAGVIPRRPRLACSFSLFWILGFRFWIEEGGRPHAVL